MYETWRIPEPHKWNLGKKEKINVNIKLSKLSCTYICVCYYVGVVHKVTSIMRCVISHFHKIMFYISYEGYNNFELISNLKGDHQNIDQIKIVVTSTSKFEWENHPKKLLKRYDLNAFTAMRIGLSWSCV